MTSPVCAVVGIGPGNGASLARRFAQGGYAVALMSRNEEYLAELERETPGTSAFPWDATDQQAGSRVFAQIRSDLGPVSVLVYNAGSGMFGDFDATEAVDLERAWQVNVGGLFVAAKQVVPDMREQGGGNIAVIGATASLRGGANFTAFASAKAAQRSLAQSMARKLGPEHIHVSYLIIDGVIDLARTRERLPDRTDEFFLKPDDIAQTVWNVTQQPESAWTFELDVRPFGETW